MKLTNIATGEVIHTMYVSRMSDNRLRVEFTADTVVYFKDETLPDTIKYAIASRGQKLHPVKGLNILDSSVEIEFSEEEILQLMKEAGVGHGE